MVSPLLLWMRLTGLEPACLATLEPKSNVSANSTTGAYNKYTMFFAVCQALIIPIDKICKVCYNKTVSFVKDKRTASKELL